jgi:hypothetical protein
MEGSVQYFGEAGVAVERYLAHTRMREAQHPSDTVPAVST